MSPFLKRLRHWYDTGLAKLRRRSWKAWAFVVGLLFLIAEIVRAVLSDAGTLLLVWIYRAVLWLGRQPMGVGGLAVVIFILALTAAAWWDSRPPKVRKPTLPAPLSETERRLVQDIRTVWGRHGHLAIGQLHDLIRNTVYELENRVYWTGLLRPVVQDLELRQQEFTAVIDQEKKCGIGEVRTHFNAMYSAYFKAMKWIALLQAREQITLGRQDDRLAIWRQNHRDMMDRLHDLEQDPEHMGTLAIHSQWIDEPEFRAFLTEAQYSEAWLALMRSPQASSATVADDEEAAAPALPEEMRDDPESGAIAS
jgi:hypothetical protein